MVLEAGMSKIEAPADLVFGGVPLPGSQSYIISHVLSIADKGTLVYLLLSGR